MERKVGQEALKPKPALRALEVVVGSWDTVGTHPFLPGKTLHGKAAFEWIEGGAFIVMRSEIDEPEIPSSIAIFGSDDAAQIVRERRQIIDISGGARRGPKSSP